MNVFKLTLISCFIGYVAQNLGESGRNGSVFHLIKKTYRQKKIWAHYKRF